MSTANYLRPRVLHYIVRPSGGRFVAHCLDYDLVVVGDSQDAALERLNFVVRTHVEVCAKKGTPNPLLHQAPNQYWDQFNRGKKVDSQLEISGLRNLDREDEKIHVGILAALVESATPACNTVY
jgi:hypothetical protein